MRTLTVFSSKEHLLTVPLILVQGDRDSSGLVFSAWLCDFSSFHNGFDQGMLLCVHVEY